jgi:hypothetical protein
LLKIVKLCNNVRYLLLHLLMMQLSEASSFRNSIMTPDQIVEKMKAGYELRNYGK